MQDFGIKVKFQSKDGATMSNRIPPLGGSHETRPPGDSNQQAKALAKSTGQFVDQGYTLLREPARADDGQFLSQFANLIKDLHQQCQEIKH